MKNHFCFAGLVIALALSMQLPAAPLDLGSPTSKTPYDAYMKPLWDVLRRLSTNQPELPLVEQLMRQGKGFRYSFNSNQPYEPQTPQETETTKSGDCKAKSLWLASKMDTRKIRFVVGKAKQVSTMSHAWLIWEGPEGWLILDATLYSRPLSPERLSNTEFIPTYSYGPAGKFSHTTASREQGSKYGDHL